MSRTVLGWIVGAIVVLGLGAVQVKEMTAFRAELAELRAELQGSQEPTTAEAKGPQKTVVLDRNSGLHGRLSSLERAVADLTKASETLMDRGMVPPSEDRLAQMQDRFFDPNASEADRVRSLRLLKRNNRQLNDEIVTQAMNLLQTSTNGNTRRQLLQQLEGVTNAALKQPIMAMLESETTRDIREGLVEVLSEFAGDAAVENKLWQLALHDPDGDVREEAQDALEDAPATPERVQKMQATALNAQASLDERLMSMRALQEANALAPEVVTEMVNLAQNSSDPVERAKLFRAFDGINDQNLMAPLVQGLQDPNPIVRENAADALGSFASDPRIKEWLNHVIANDTDPRVKREAHAALEQSQRRGRRGR